MTTKRACGWMVAAVLLSAGWLSLQSAPAQERPTHTQRPFASTEFAGTWHWMFQGKPFATMTLQPKGDQFTGSITNGSIDMDKDGRITRAMPEEGASPILRTSFQDGTLHIVGKDGNEETEWSMTLTSATTGELRIGGAGAPAQAEPIKLEKLWSEPPLRP